MIKREFAVYRGDKFIMTGTKQEIAKTLNITIGTVNFYLSNAYEKRRNVDKGIYIFEIDTED